MSPSIKRAATITLAAAALIGGGAAVAAIPAPDGTITACVKGRGEYFPANGVCKKGQNKVTWNAKGIQGDKGLKGDKGDIGPAGTGQVFHDLAYNIQDGSTTPFVVVAVDDAPNGIYSIMATVRVSNYGESQDEGECFITSANDIDYPFDLSPSESETLVIIGKHEGGPGDISVSCSSDNGIIDYSTANIVATKVG